MNTKVNENIEINGVVLTEKCLTQLQRFQVEKNNYLMEQILLLGEVSDYLSKRLFGRSPNEEGDNENTARLISDIAFLKDDLKKLAIPNVNAK